MALWLTLAQWVLGITMFVLTVLLALAGFWLYDQRRPWFVEVDGEGGVGWGKRDVTRGLVKGKDSDGDNWEIKLRNDWGRYRKGIRSGRVYKIDTERGVQLPWKDGDDDGTSPGFALGAIAGARIGENMLRGERDWKEEAAKWLGLAAFGISILLGGLMIAGG